MVTSGTGDQIIAYIVQNTTNTIFPIAAVDFNSTTSWDANATSTETSALPKGLTEGTNAVALNSTNDNGYFGCDGVANLARTQSAMLTFINGSAKWVTSNTQIINPVNGLPPCIFSITSPALPVQLILFEGRLNLDNIDIFWKTASETQNSNFEIQKSRNAKSFESLARIDGNGDSDNINRYLFTDSEPYDGSNYYRLRQTDYDGSENYSKIIEVHWETDRDYVIIYPNPLSSGQELQIQKSERFQFVDIVDLNGRKKSVNELNQGSYLLKFTDNYSKVIVKRLIVE